MKKYFVLVAAFLFSCTSEVESPDSILQKYLSLNEISSSSEGGYLSEISSSSRVVNPNPGESSSSSVGVNPNPGESSSSSVGVNPNPGEDSSSSEAGTPQPYQALKDTNFAINVGTTASPWKKNINNSVGYINRYTVSSRNFVTFSFKQGVEIENDWDLQLRQSDVNIKAGFSYKLEFGGNTKGGNSGPIAFVLLHCEESGECISGDYINWSETLSSAYSVYEYSWRNCGVTDPNTIFLISAGFADVSFDIYYVSILAEPIDCSED